MSTCPLHTNPLLAFLPTPTHTFLPNLYDDVQHKSRPHTHKHQKRMTMIKTLGVLLPPGTWVPRSQRVHCWSAPRDGKDVAGKGNRGRGGRAVPLHLRLRLHGDVCRCGARTSQGPVRTGERCRAERLQRACMFPPFFLRLQRRRLRTESHQICGNWFSGAVDWMRSC